MTTEALDQAWRESPEGVAALQAFYAAAYAAYSAYSAAYNAWVARHEEET